MLVKIVVGLIIVILFFRLAGWVLGLYLRYRLGKFMAAQQAKMQEVFTQASQGTSSRAEEKMVRCSHCGVFVPRTQATIVEGLSFCDAAHSQAWRAKNN